MVYAALGILGFSLIHLFDFVSLKRIPFLKPILWSSGSALLVYAILMVSLLPDKFLFPLQVIILGWILFGISTFLFLYSLFINLPIVNTYIKRGVASHLVTRGLYSLVRHPGVYGFTMMMIAVLMVSGVKLLIVIAPVWIFVDVVLVIFQDKYVFIKMFPNYNEYKKQTPMLIPNKRSITNFIKSFEKERANKKKEDKKMITEAELFQQGKYEELWQRCCGFIDLGIDDFMRIQRRLLLEQINLLSKCKLGQEIMGGIVPASLEEFRNSVPLTTYADYAPYFLKRRMDVTPKKPILWQCTSGKSGEYPYLWAPVTAQQLYELEPYMFALFILSSCNKKGEINLRGGDRCFYGMAPPPYATGTMTRVFPYELFNSLPSIEESETMTFEERLKKGFELALSQGLDMTLAMSSVAVAIGERFSKQGQNGTSLRSLFKKPRTMLRLMKGLARSKLARRPLMPKDIWSLKGLVTFGIDGSVYKERIREMWGKYALDFHGCTEAPFIALQTWDYEGMTFVPNLNLFEFIPEAELKKARDDESYQPQTLLMDELEPGNYELVITSFQGGPFIRYRVGHMVRIISLRNERLNIDIPQMEFISRVDDQIDIAGFTRLSEKIIWQAIENTGLSYKDWVVRKEVGEKPTLHLYIETKQNGYVNPEQISNMVHEELKKLDLPYAEMESFTGLKPLEVTLLPEDAFESYKRKRRKEGADLASLKPPHLNPPEDTIGFLVSVERKVAVKTEEESERERVEA